jgi:hypothetical protein
MGDKIKEEMETCTGQCGYSPICRKCELEKKRKCMEAALRKKKNEENTDFDPQP